MKSLYIYPQKAWARLQVIRKSLRLRFGKVLLPIVTLESIRSGCQLPVLVICSFEDIRSGPLASGVAQSPLNKAAEYIASGHSVMQAKDYLREFYKDIRFSTWGDFLGEKEQDSRVLQFSPLAEIWPWSDDIDERAKTCGNKQAIRREFRKYGHLEDNELSFYFGPASERKISWELNRLIAVVNSIKEKGYTRHNRIDGDIAGWALIHNGEMIIHIHSGLHRLAALRGLRYENILVRIDGVYDSRFLEDWGAVEGGLYSKKLTMRILARIFESR